MLNLGFSPNKKITQMQNKMSDHNNPILSTQKPRYSKAEIARRGDHLYETQIYPKLDKADHGHFD